MTPGDFWSSTLDEVVLMFRGKVDDWRVHRNCAYLIHCSMIPPKDRVPLVEAIPLPFDDDKVDSTDMIEDYWRLVKSGALN